jgi:aminobenzoyl-glutamate utilization protein B
MQDIARITDLIAAKQDRFIRLADEIWGLAEIRWEEQASAARQEDAIAAEGFSVRRGVADIPTAFVAEAGSGAPVIAILGEYDALSGLSQEAGVAERRPMPGSTNGHGCGHNLLGTAGLMAAVAVKDFLAASNLPGTVRYYGCPAEEGGSAKTFMVRAGLFADVDAAVTWHPGTFSGVFPMDSLANVQAYFRFSGKAAHAAAAPHLGRSALDAVELMNVGVNYMREHMPSDARIHNAITDTGGVSPNVVQAHAEVLYLVRAPEIAETRELFDRVVEIARGAAMMTQTTMEFEIDRATSELKLNPVVEQAMHENLVALGGVPFDGQDIGRARAFAATYSASERRSDQRAFGVTVADDVVMYQDVMPYDGRRVLLPGSTDVADVSWVVPTAQYWGACYPVGTPGHSWQLVAQGKLPAAHTGMAHAAKVMASTALDLIRDPDLLERAKAEQRRRVPA